MKKKIISLFITVILFITALPVNTNALHTTYRDHFPFRDTPINSWYTEAVDFCYANGFMKGVSNTAFSPLSVTTREQIISIIANISKEDITGYTESPFADVKEGAWFTSAVLWAYSKGYTNGIGNGKFGLGKEITRQEAVTMFYNYVKDCGYELSYTEDILLYEDACDIADWAYEAFSWACASSIIQGYNNKIDPNGKLTRVQAAQIIKNLAYNVLYAHCEHAFPEKNCTKATVCTLCGLFKGVASGHRMNNLSDCERVCACIDCAEILSPAQGHDFKAATCTQPLTCTKCKKTEGSALGHTTSSGVCARCSVEVFSNVYDKMLYYLKKKGILQGTKKSFYARINYTSGRYADQYVTYDEQLGYSYFRNLFRLENGDSVECIIRMNSVASVYTYTVNYAKDEVVCYSGSGNLSAASFKAGSKINFSNYTGDSKKKSDLEAIASNSIYLNLEGANRLLSDELKMSVKDFGFLK